MKRLLTILVALVLQTACHMPDTSKMSDIDREMVEKSFATKHTCIHSKLAKKYKPQHMPEGRTSPQMRQMEEHLANKLAKSQGVSFRAAHKQATSGFAVDGWHQIRIFLDFSFAATFVARNPSLQSRYALAARLTQSVRKYFQENLFVNYYTYMNFKGGNCPELSIRPYVGLTDLYIVIYPENDSSTFYFAAATSCYLSGRDRRPTMGAYYLNFAFLRTGALYEYVYFSTFAHEFTHILGFSENLYGLFVNPNTGSYLGYNNVITSFSVLQPDRSTGGTSGFLAISLPEVRDLARQFFGCPTLPGLPLENNGGGGSANSHWEKLFLPLEFMNPQVEYPAIISDFTLALLRGSGWYKTKVGAAQRYDFGKNSGCNHFQVCPSTMPGYCNSAFSSKKFCTPEYMSTGVCFPETVFSAGCRIQLTSAQSCQIDSGIQKYLGEQYGPNSRCLLWTATSSTGTVFPRPKCQQVRCNNNGTLTIIYNSTLNLLCQFSGQLIRVPPESYLLNCPDINDFCTEYRARCPNDCMNRGICLDGGICSCFDGFSGTDCSQATLVNSFRFSQLRAKPSEAKSPLIEGHHLQQKQEPAPSKYSAVISTFAVIALSIFGFIV